MLQRAAGALPLSRRELGLVAAAMGVGLVIRIAYVLITKDHALAGDELEHDLQARFILDGHWFWSTTPYGIPHPSLWKPPGYIAWVGVWYSIVGDDPDRVFLVQAFLGPVTIALTWLLGRRLFNPTVGIVAAALVAIYPLAWQFEVRLYSEALAIPLTLVVLLLVLDRVPTPRRAALVGAVMGVSLLVRPTAVMLFAGVLVAWWLAAGLRRGTAMTALAVVVAALVVAPWTYRNYQEEGGFVPISVQDAAGFGVFNDVAANDPKFPYAWRAEVPGALALLERRPPLNDTEFRSELQDQMWDYIGDHPESVPKAFFWNGLSRLWDVRRPSYPVAEVPFEGRTKSVTIAGLVMYYVLLPLALVALWRMRRRRRELVLPLLAIALAASVVFTLDAGTRYRATLEPVIALLAASTAVELWRRLPLAGPDRPA